VFSERRKKYRGLQYPYNKKGGCDGFQGRGLCKSGDYGEYKAYLDENFTEEERGEAAKDLGGFGRGIKITPRDLVNHLIAKRSGTNRFPGY